MSKIEKYTDEIMSDLRPFDFEHNRKHIRLVVGRLIGDDTVTEEKRAKFKKYVQALESTRQEELPDTEGTPYRIKIIDHRMPDLVEDKPLIVEICEFFVLMFKKIMKR